MKINHPFQKKKADLQTRRIEFRHFLTKAPKIIEDIKRSNRTIAELDDIYGSHIDLDRRDALQFSFGTIPSDRQDPDGKLIAENGGTLLYSFGPDGTIATIIYPAKSDHWSPSEDHIFLRIGRFSGNWIIDRLGRDFSDLAAYTYVTAIDGNPTLWQILRIWWLRHVHPFQINGQFRHPRIFQYSGKAAEFTFRTMLAALLKPISILCVIALLIAFGYGELVNLFVEN